MAFIMRKFIRFWFTRFLYPIMLLFNARPFRLIYGSLLTEQLIQSAHYLSRRAANEFNSIRLYGINIFYELLDKAGIVSFREREREGRQEKKRVGKEK